MTDVQDGYKSTDLSSMTSIIDFGGLTSVLKDILDRLRETQLKLTVVEASNVSLKETVGGYDARLAAAEAANAALRAETEEKHTGLEARVAGLLTFF